MKRDFATFLQKLDSIQANQEKHGAEIKAIHEKLNDDGVSPRGRNNEDDAYLRLPVETAMEFDELEDMMSDEKLQRNLVS